MHPSQTPISNPAHVWYPVNVPQIRYILINTSIRLYSVKGLL